MCLHEVMYISPVYVVSVYEWDILFYNGIFCSIMFSHYRWAKAKNRQQAKAAPNRLEDEEEEALNVVSGGAQRI